MLLLYIAPNSNTAAVQPPPDFFTCPVLPFAVRSSHFLLLDATAGISSATAFIIDHITTVLTDIVCLVTARRNTHLHARTGTRLQRQRR